MFLSKLTFDACSPATWHLLRTPYELHRALSIAFSEDTEEYLAARPLYRVEENGERAGGPVILVQSRLRADWSRLRMGERQLRGEPQQREFVLSLSAGQTLAFRLRANPCRAVKGEKRGKRVSLWEPKPLSETEDERAARLDRIARERESWMHRKLESAGARVANLRVTPEGGLHFAGPGGKIVLDSVLYEGILQVVEPEPLVSAVANGVGSGKGFGFGLLSLARV